MRCNTYFGVKSLETVVNGIKALSPEAQAALFLGVGIAVYGYFKYKKGENKDGK